MIHTPKWCSTFNPFQYAHNPDVSKTFFYFRRTRIKVPTLEITLDAQWVMRVP